GADDGTFGVIAFFMALLSFHGLNTQSLAAQGEQRLPPFFNSGRDIPRLSTATGSVIVVEGGV
ncbi:MAG: hypothetical protein RLN99_15025, partial [Kiloniellaceae bacterium]